MLFRFAILPYANALPLVHCIPQVCPEAELVCRTPRQALDALLTDHVDTALVPLIDHFRNPEVSTVEGLGICADGDVTSVLLQCRRPLREVRTVRPDPESRTSNVLVQILLAEHFHVAPEILSAPEPTAADACVCIGDRALTSSRSLETYDLAGEWKKMTGLPFVFAAWLVRRSCPNIEEITGVLRAAKELGCQSLQLLAQLAAARLNLPEDRCRDYLGRRLHYDLGPRERQAIDLFGSLAMTVPCPDVNRPCPAVSLGGRR